MKTSRQNIAMRLTCKMIFRSFIRQYFPSFYICLLLLLSGCSLPELRPEIPTVSVGEKQHIKVAVLIPQSTRNLTEVTLLPSICGGGSSGSGSGSGGDFYKKNYGVAFENAVTGIFSQMFDQVDIVLALPQQRDYSIIFEATLTQVYIKPGCFIANGAVAFVGALRAVDTAGNEVWRSKNTSKQFEEIVKFPPKGLEEYSKLLSSSIVKFVEEWASELKTLPVQRYAKYQEVIQSLVQSPASTNVVVIDKQEPAYSVQTYVEDTIRFENVAYRILTKATSICKGETMYLTGMWFANAMSLKEFKEDAAKVYGLSNTVKIMHIVPGSAAEIAGLKAGDIPIAFDTWRIGNDEEAIPKLQAQLAEVVKQGKSVMVTVQRDGSKRQFTVIPEKACAIKLGVSDENAIDAFTPLHYGKGEAKRDITITRGMLRFIKDDTELAMVVSHAVGHIVLAHQKRAGYVFGGIIDFLLAGKGELTGGAISRLGGAVSEDEAVRLGLYIMVAAGLDVERSQQFWNRLFETLPNSGHILEVSKSLVLETTIKEISKKRQAGIPVVP